MKIKKWGKVAIILQAIYTFCCVLSIFHSVVPTRFYSRIFFYGWVLNPIGLILLVFGLFLFFSAKRSEENRKLIGKKWLGFIAYFLIDAMLYLITAAFTFIE